MSEPRDPYVTPPPTPYLPGQQPARAQQTSYAPPADPGRRPLALTLAVAGLWVAGALVAVEVVMPLLDLGSVTPVGTSPASTEPTAAQEFVKAAGVTIVGSIMIGLLVWMAIAASQAIVWARVLATIFGGIAIVVLLVSLAGDAVDLISGDTGRLSHGYVVAETAVNCARLVVSVAILVLLWLPATSAHYRAREAVRQHQTMARGY
ncbi:MAG: hypothetical protein J2O46_05030 [Nocardioides sp.]|nr:hypothetical protein [Nocardioides sp.]